MATFIRASAKLAYAFLLNDSRALLVTEGHGRY